MHPADVVVQGVLLDLKGTDWPLWRIPRLQLFHLLLLIFQLFRQLLISLKPRSQN
jgi:hypothetical protein